MDCRLCGQELAAGEVICRNCGFDNTTDMRTGKPLPLDHPEHPDHDDREKEEP